MANKTVISPHQAQFDAEFISGGEILKILDISRPTYSIFRNEQLPPPIQIMRYSFWKRDEIMPTIINYKQQLDSKR